MSSILPLWLPTLLAAVGVFIASFLIHMVVKWHANDQKGLPNETAVADALRGAAPGEYRLPYAKTMQEMKTPEFEEKAKRGPIAIIGVAVPSPDFGFGKALGLWFVYCLVVSWLSSHIAWGAFHGAATAPPDFMIFHTVGLSAWLGYGMALSQQSIWGPKPWGPTIRSMIDALVYALVTAGIFTWRWPR
jgi:hypothetical protein